MAEPFEFEIKPKGIDSTVRELRALENTLEGVGESMEGAGGASSNMAQNITASVVAAQAAFAAISKLVTAVRAAADEFERQSGILNRFTGNVDEAARRTNGLISSLDLMSAQSRATAAGLELTEDQFATLAVRASEFAASTGQDATQALNRLVQAAATGRAGALRELGVELEGITDTAEKQREAIRQLTEGYEDAESSADTFGGRIATLETEFDNLQTEMIGVLNDSGLLEDAFDNMANAVSSLIGEINIFGESEGPISSIEAFVVTGAAMLSAFTQQLSATAEAVNAAMDVIANPTNIEALERLSAATDNIGFDAFERQVDEDSLRGLGNMLGARQERLTSERTRVNRGRRRAGGSGGPNSTTQDTKSAELTAQEKINRLAEEQEALEERLLSNQIAKGEAAAEIAKLERERLDLMAQQTAETLKQKEALEQAALAELERQNNMRRSQRVQDGLTQGLEGIATVTKRTIALTEEGGMSTKEAFKTAVDEWLKQLAVQEAWKGAAATVEAIGLAITNPPAAGTKVAEAAGHFAIAAAAGGASAAIPNAAGGAGAQEAARPTDANVGGGGGGGNITHVTNFNSPTAVEQVGRLQNRANRAAARRYDA